jgi:hypothetical protein
LEWDLKDYGCRVELYITFFDNHKVLFIKTEKKTSLHSKPHIFLISYSFGAIKTTTMGVLSGAVHALFELHKSKTHGKRNTNENECVDITKCLNTHPSPNIEPLFFYTLILFSSFCSI